MTRISTDKTTIVDDSIKWRRITPETEKGRQMWLIKKSRGVGMIGILDAENRYGYTHWYPYPTFDKDEDHDTEPSKHLA